MAQPAVSRTSSIQAIPRRPPGVPPPGGWSTVDLHLHTTASDGRLTPTETLALAVKRGLCVIAITDHDSTEGVAAGIVAAQGTGIEVIPGVEINTEHASGEVHVLGYFVDHLDAGLQASLADRRRARMERGLMIVNKLRGIGLDIDWERVQEIAGADEGGAVGRPHVARALVEKGYVASTNEAFEKYIGRDGPGYVTYEKFSPEQAIGVIRRAGGLAVFAHPSTVPNLSNELKPLIEAGLEGLECYYGAYPRDVVQGLVSIANSLGLVVTGGSDYHGIEETTYNATLGGAAVPMSVVDGLKARHALSVR